MKPSDDVGGILLVLLTEMLEHAPLVALGKQPVAQFDYTPAAGMQFWGRLVAGDGGVAATICWRPGAEHFSGAIHEIRPGDYDDLGEIARRMLRKIDWCPA